MRSGIQTERISQSIVKITYCETPILKAQRIGIGKLNNPALAEGIIPRSLLR
jgi:hypothetical protein